MAQQSPSGAQMYEAEWQLDGKSVVRLYIHAANEADVLAQAEGFFTRLLAHPYRQVAPVAEVVKATGSSDALVDRADTKRRAEAHEQIAQTNERLTPPAKRVTGSTKGLVKPTDERLARDTEQISKPGPDAVQNPLSVQGRPLSSDRPAMRGLVGLLLLRASLSPRLFRSHLISIWASCAPMGGAAKVIGPNDPGGKSRTTRRTSRTAERDAIGGFATTAYTSEHSRRRSLDRAQILQAMARDWRN
jgi:hypothetical protein